MHKLSQNDCRVSSYFGKQAAPLSERGHPLKKGFASSRAKRVLATARRGSTAQGEGAMTTRVIARIR